MASSPLLPEVETRAAVSLEKLASQTIFSQIIKRMTLMNQLMTEVRVTRLETKNIQRIKAYVEEHVDVLHKTLCVYVYKSGLAKGNQVQQEAQDLLSEVVERALKKADTFDPNKRIMAWLLGIASNVILQEKQKRAKRQRREPFLHDLQQQHAGQSTSYRLEPKTARDVEEIFASFEHYEALLSCVSPEERQLLHWSAVEQMSAKEIAARLDCTPGAVRVRIYRACKTLREALQQRGRHELSTL